MVAERGTRPPPDVDTPVPQLAERLLEVPKIIPQDRIQQQTVEQFIDSSEATRANLAEAEKSLAALMTSQAVSKSSYTQVASGHEASVKIFAEELKAWTEATEVLQSETSGDDRQTYSPFQENPNAALQTPTDLKGFDMMTAVRQLAEQEHSAALAQLASCISAITKFGADADNDLFMKVKDLITDLIRSQADAPPKTNQKSHCDEEKLLSVAYKKAVDNRRAAWRVITSVGQKKKSKSEEQLASYAREYIANVENELQKIREGVLALMDKKLVPSPSTDESKAFYYKMKSDYHRYLAEQNTEAPETSSRDRTLQCMAKQLVEVLETVFRNRVQQRTVEQIVDAPVPQAVEEPAEVSRVFSQDEIQQRVMEQDIETPAVSLVEKIVEMPVTWKTQQGVNTHVQHVVNTVEVERPKIVKETVQEEINQMTKHAKVPRVCAVKKTAEAPQVHVSEETVEIAQLQAAEKIVETPETQTIQGAMKSSSSRKKRFMELVVLFSIHTETVLPVHWEDGTA